MDVYSFAEQGSSLFPVKVEVALMKGLPDIVIMGLPDQVLKESLIRIKSALRNQGFRLPTTQKVLVNLKPTDQKKAGRGLELAIAMAILYETEQIERPSERVWAYGQLGLKGEVEFLEEINWAPLEEKTRVWTGPPEQVSYRELKVIHELQQLFVEPDIYEPQKLRNIQRPAFTSKKFKSEQSELLKILAHGGHHSLMAGPAGSGKSTLAYALHSLLPDPDMRTALEIQKWQNFFESGKEIWRPLQAPHHTATPQALLGGGNPPTPGEITRAHGGILLMDEFLEFPIRQREALREPMERREVRISRRGHSEMLPADFQLVATSNFCPCGELVPKKHEPPCRFSKTKCQSYLERLSGPLADRFDLMAFSHNWNEGEESSAKNIFESVIKAQEFQIKRGQSKKNAHLQWAELLKDLERPSHLSYLPEALRSRRRHCSILRVARTLADLDGSEKIQIPHLKKARDWAWVPFEDLRRCFL